MLPLSQPFSSTPAFALLVTQIESTLHNERERAQQQIDALLAKTRSEHDAFGFVTATELQAQIAFGENLLDLHFEALQMAQSHHLFDCEARLLNLIGRAYYTSAHYQDALQTWARCLEAAELSQQYNAWVKAKMGLGQVYDALGDPESAVKMHTEAIVRCESLDDAWLLLQAKINLGVNLHKLRRSDEALAAFNFALDTARSLKHADDEAEALMRIAEVYLSRQSYMRAMTALEAAQTIAQRTGYLWALSQILRLRGECLLRMDRPKDALNCVQQGLDVAQKAGAVQVRMNLLYLLSEICEQLGDLAAALQMQRQAQTLERQIKQATQIDPLQQLAQLSGLGHNPDQILLELASNLQWERADLPQLSLTLCQTACQVLNVAQASFWQWPHAQVMHCVSRCNAAGAVLPVGPDLAHSSFSALFACLQRGEMVIAHTSAQHLYTWQWSEFALQQQGIDALILVPIRLNDDTIAVLACEHQAGQRNWRRDEIAHAQQLGLLATRAMAQYQQRFFQQQIAQLNTKLLQQNDELEIRVEQRTQDLAHAMQQLIQAEKLAALGNLVAGFAHELNTPLGNILTAASTFSETSQEANALLMSGQLKKNQLVQLFDEGRQIAELIERNARRASDLIANLQQLTNDQAQQRPHYFSPHDLLAQLLRHLEPKLRAKAVSVSNQIAGEIRMNSFAAALELILHQLIQNSLLHAFAGRDQGRITIHSEPVSDDQIRLIYRDDGVGLASHLQNKVFDPFYTTQFGQGRSGLGLYQVYSLVHGKLGGEIILRSELGQGLEMTLTLPLSMANVSE
jgi:two-component system NtrC family sensor kinase